MINKAAIMHANLEPCARDGFAVVPILDAIVEAIALVQQANLVDGATRNQNANECDVRNFAQPDALGKLQWLTSDVRDRPDYSELGMLLGCALERGEATGRFQQGIVIEKHNIVGASGYDGTITVPGKYERFNSTDDFHRYSINPKW